ncbi:MAG: MaoC/PaaZ C-terminal domain-containing protein [Solirubrobacterales bacterium]
MSAQATPTGVEGLVGHSIGSSVAVYEERDAILYALALGAAAGNTDLVYERRLRVLPTYALALGLWAVEAVGALGAYDPVKTLHVGQRLAVHGELPRRGGIEMTAAVEAVWDKGSAALVEIAVASELFDAVYGIWVPGAGGFGGERGPSSRTSQETAAPDLRIELETAPEQAALYRLTGDLHPLHIDPEVAAAAGFPRPILHGLCALGACTLSLAAAAGADPVSLRQLSARFAAPVFPGQTLSIEAWREEGDGPALRFGATAGEDAVLSGGRLGFARRGGEA